MRMGELARATGTKVETIRYHEHEGLIPAPSNTRGDYRSYDETHLHRLSFIRRSRKLGFSIDNIRDLMSLADHAGQAASAGDAIAAAHVKEIDRKVAGLQALRAELVRHWSVAAGPTAGATSSRPWGRRPKPR